MGMGKDFFESFLPAREVFQEADEILKRPLSNILFDGPAEALNETRNSQTGIYVVSMAILQVLKEQFPLLTPAVCAGLSLGEYSALTASKRLSFQSTLPVVQYRGDVMNEACEKTQGTMAAIFGLSSEEIEALVREAEMPEDLWVANFNCPGQTVISGTLAGVQKGSELAKQKGAKRVIPLKVHGAFHSGLMRSAEEKLKARLAQVELTDSSLDFVMNVPGTTVKGIEPVRNYLVKQVTSPVRWEQSVRSMQGIDLYLSIGFGKTLEGLNKYMNLSAPTLSISSISDLDSLSKMIN